MRSTCTAMESRPCSQQLEKAHMQQWKPNAAKKKKICKLKQQWHTTTYLRMVKILTTDNPKCWQRCGAARTLTYCWWECKVVQALWKTVWQFLIKLNIFLPYDPAVKLLGIYPMELKTYVCTKMCTQMFIAALFITAKTWKQPRCPSVGERINRLWCTKTMEYYSALKRNELSSHYRDTEES